MGKIQDAINQAFGLASPPSRDAQRGGGSNFTDKQARKAHRWLGKKDPVGKARGDRRGTPPEDPLAFYRRQREEHEAHLRAERAKQENQQTKDRQGPDGNPLRGPWGGVY